jgi:hypothetical protein
MVIRGPEMAGLNTTKLEINAIDHTIFESSTPDRCSERAKP